MLLKNLSTPADTAGIISEVAENLPEPKEQIVNDLNRLRPDQILEYLKSLTPNFISLIYQFLTIIIILFVGQKIIHYLAKLFNKFISKFNIDLGIKKFLLSLFKAVCYVILVLIIAGRVGINSTAIFAVISSAGLAIGLALQGSLSNFAGGILILLTKPFIIGDFISTTLAEGKVHDIGLVYTTVITYDNKKVTIPNGTLANGVITNITHQAERLVDIKIGISYNADLKKAKDTIINVCKKDIKILQNKDINCFVSSLDASCVTLGIRVWCKKEDYLTTLWGLNENIKLALDAADIEIPFNQLDVHIR